MAAISACAPSGNPPEMPVAYWRTLSGAAGDAQEELVRRYNERHPDTPIVAEFQGSYADLATKLMASAAAGRGPRVAQLGTFEILTFARGGTLADLRPFIEGENGINTSDWPPSLLKAGEVDGGIYWLPFNVSVPVLYWNQEAFEEADLSGPPETWDAFFEAAERLTVRDDAGRVQQAGVSLWQITWPVVSMIWAEGGALCNRDYSEITLDHPVAVRVLTRLQALVRDGAANFPNPASGGHRAQFLSGRAAMILDSQAIFGDVFEGGAAFTPRVAPFPAGQAGRVYAPGGGGLVMPAGVPESERAAAWSFIRWMLDTPQQTYFFEKTGYIPVTNEARDQAKAASLGERYEVLLDAAPHVRGDFSINMMPPLRDAFDAAYQTIMTQPDSDVATVLAEADAQAEAGIAQSPLLAK